MPFALFPSTSTRIVLLVLRSFPPMETALPCSLPTHGRIGCSICHSEPIEFDESRTVSADASWRITANPLSWGNPDPEILVLGFSKDPSQAGPLSTLPHNEIPYRRGRKQVGKILAHVGLFPATEPDRLRELVSQAIADTRGRFGWGSLVRCTVERFDYNRKEWVGSGGMIDEFMDHEFGKTNSNACAQRFLGDLPSKTKLVVMFGLGSRQSYVTTARKVIEAARPGRWRTLNEVAYTDGRVTVVHVEHFASQGADIPNWLGLNNHPRSRLGLIAREAVIIGLAAHVTLDRLTR